MLLGEMFVLTVQSSRFSHYCSEFPAVNMWILKHNNLNIIKWMAETRMRRVHSFYNMKIVVFQYEHVDSRKLWKILRKATWCTENVNFRAWYITYFLFFSANVSSRGKWDKLLLYWNGVWCWKGVLVLIHVCFVLRFH